MNKKIKAVVASVNAAAFSVVALANAGIVQAQNNNSILQQQAAAAANQGTPIVPNGNVGSEFTTTLPNGYAMTFGGLLSFVLRAVLAIGALLVFAYLVLGGIEYITSGGDKGKTEKSRDKITAAIIGLIILAASWAILNLALSFLGLGNLPTALDSVGTINQ